jgi:signal transduction histidine kinase
MILKVKCYNNEPQAKPMDEIFQIRFVQYIRELLFNVVRYVNTDEARIILSYPNQEVRIMAEDDDVGFDRDKTEPDVTEDGGCGLLISRTD